MITEDYVSFETAKLLKEKGFNYPCRVVYSPKGVVKHYLKEEAYAHHLKGHKKLCPTLQMAMKWLREVHHVACFICPSIEQGFHTNKWNSYIDKLSDNFPKDSLWFVETSDSYEQACEAAIKYCLENLI